MPAKLEQSVEELLSEAYQLRTSNLIESIALTRKALKLAQDANPRLHARASTLLGLFLMIKGDFNQSLVCSSQSLAYFEGVNDLKGMADAKYNIGSVYYKTDNYHVGLECLLDCLTLYRELEDYHNEARVLKSIGTIYEYFGDVENAVESYRRCIEAAEKVSDQNQVSNAYNPLSGIYLDQNNPDQAFEIIHKAIRIKESTGDRRGLAYSIYGRGKCHLKVKEYNKALADFELSASMHKESADRLGQGMVFNKLGQTYMAIGEYRLAKQHFLKAVAIASEINIKFILFKAHHHLYQLELEQKNTEEALHHLELYIKLKETVINNDTINIIKSYQSIKKIESLELEAKIQKERAEIIGRKNAELDSFFYRISHDLKGPIASLLGLRNMVEMEIAHPPSKYYFDLYHSQILRINNIVMDLINLTRMNHAEGIKTQIDFERLIQECIHSYSYLENFKGIQFITEIEKDLVFDSEWAIVNTILQNLIENSIKYTRKNAQSYVAIRVARENDQVKIQVEDNGVGIRESDQPRVFDMFFRANDYVQGTGLGLYILKRAVERLGGSVIFTSELQAGTSFTVFLPFNKKK